MKMIPYNINIPIFIVDTVTFSGKSTNGYLLITFSVYLSFNLHTKSDGGQYFSEMRGKTINPIIRLKASCQRSIFVDGRKWEQLITVLVMVVRHNLNLVVPLQNLFIIFCFDFGFGLTFHHIKKKNGIKNLSDEIRVNTYIMIQSAQTMNFYESLSSLQVDVHVSTSTSIVAIFICFQNVVWILGILFFCKIRTLPRNRKYVECHELLIVDTSDIPTLIFQGYPNMNCIRQLRTVKPIFDSFNVLILYINKLFFF